MPRFRFTVTPLWDTGYAGVAVNTEDHRFAADEVLAFFDAGAVNVNVGITPINEEI